VPQDEIAEYLGALDEPKRATLTELRDTSGETSFSL
jgi:hypothetical protein